MKVFLFFTARTFCCGFGLALFCSAISVASGDSVISSKNWKRHPAIKKIRTIYNDINLLREKKKLETKERNLDYEGFRGDASIFIDSKRNVRIYSELTGVDFTAKREYYYDVKNNLRFIYQEDGKPTGALIGRYYFDETGTLLWPEKLHNIAIIKNPEAHFEGLCTTGKK